MNSILALEGKDTVEVQGFENTENISMGIKSKITYLDILVKDKRDNKYIIEMQLAYQKNFEKRVQYYAAHVYSNDILQRGNKYKKLKKVVCLTITGHKLFADDLEQFGKLVHAKQYRREHLILDKETHEHALQDLSWVFVEIPKFDLPISQLRTLEDRWCSLLRGDANKVQDINVISDHTLELNAAFEQLKSSQYTKEEIARYRSDILYANSQNVDREDFIEVGRQQEREKNRRENYEKDLDTILDYLEDGKDDTIIINRLKRKGYNKSESDCMLQEAKQRKKAN